MGPNFPWTGVGSAWPCLILNKKWPKKQFSKGCWLLVQLGYSNIPLVPFFWDTLFLSFGCGVASSTGTKGLEDPPRVETSGEGLGGQADLDKHKHKHTAHSAQAQAQDLDKHKHKHSTAHAQHKTQAQAQAAWVSVLARTLTSASLHLDHQRDLQLCFPFFLSLSLPTCVNPEPCIVHICCRALE